MSRDFAVQAPLSDTVREAVAARDAGLVETRPTKQRRRWWLW